MHEKIVDGFSCNIVVPEEFKLICKWVDNNGYSISGYFELEPDDRKYITHWFGFDDVNDRFGVFGADGSGALYAFWIDDEGNQKIVHLGSEGDTYILLLMILSSSCSY